MANVRRSAASDWLARTLCQQLLVEHLDVSDHLAGAELANRLEAGLAELPSQLRVVEQAKQGVGEGLGVGRRGEKAVHTISDGLRVAVDGGGDDGQPGGHGLGQDAW